MRTNQKKNKEMNQNSMVVQEMARLGNSTINLGNPPCQSQIMTNKPHSYAMHAKTGEENMHENRYLQE